jgi:anti-sigma factor ChrR (cupin superfamily)
MRDWIARLSSIIAPHPSEATLQSYADGELRPWTRRRVFRHVGRCSACRNLLEADQAVLQFISATDVSARALADTREKLFERLQWESTHPAAAVMRHEILGLLGRTAAGAVTRLSSTIPPPLEAQIVAFLGTQAALRFRQRWTAAAGA